MIGALGVVLLFLFVPETFWDRTPTRKPHKRPSFLRRLSSRHGHSKDAAALASGGTGPDDMHLPQSPGKAKNRHVGFAANNDGTSGDELTYHVPARDDLRDESDQTLTVPQATYQEPSPTSAIDLEKQQPGLNHSLADHSAAPAPSAESTVAPGEQNTVNTLDPSQGPLGAAQRDQSEVGPDMRAVNSPLYTDTPRRSSAGQEGYFTNGFDLDNEKIPASRLRAPPKVQAYTHNLRQQPPKSFVQQLKPYHGRLNNDKWFKVMLRPFVLFAYPAVLWSSLIYACSIGWLIVISESLAILYRDPELYNFTALQTGLTYISPFVGGILGTGVAGKVSDIIVRAMSRRNGGLYEPEFRLVMAIPITITTCIGLMGFGWSAQEKDHWMVPTTFFGIISFGCSLGSTTSITFCVDSYRQYAGEALVTLNFSKNIFHGLVFSLFVTHWLAHDGPKMVFIWIGVIQLIACVFTIPMYIYGKRMRMWTVRKNLMEKF